MGMLVHIKNHWTERCFHDWAQHVNGGYIVLWQWRDMSNNRGVLCSLSIEQLLVGGSCSRSEACLRCLWSLLHSTGTQAGVVMGAVRRFQ